jgi:DNA repair exonuclease SbcCD ATPase subunit
LRIQELDLKSFLVHKNRKVNFPATGPVVITGKNGTGKSTFIHAVTWALYGKVVADSRVLSLAPKVEGDVRLVTDTVIVHRSKGLVWNLPGEQPTAWKTTTIANDQLAAVLPSFQTWYRTHVATSDDVTFFTASTDKQRKEFMEDLLGITELDEPYNLAKADYEAALAEVEAANREIEKMKAVVDAFEAEKFDLEKHPEPTHEERMAVRELHAALKAKTDERLRPLVEKLQDVKTRLSIHKGWLETMGGGSCPTCKQKIDPSVIEETRNKKEKYDQAYARLSEEIAKVKAELADDQRVWREAQDLLQEKEEKWRAWHVAARSREQAAEKVRLLKEKIAAVAERASAIDLELHRDCKLALSHQGVRSWVVGQTLDEVTDLANIYLTKLSTNLQVKLKGYTELQKGGTTDAISLTVSTGGGKFWSVSQGQRQRVSLAIRLAVAGLRKSNGTMFLDECFSNMDSEGVDGAVSLLHELSQERCIVVITHDQRLARALQTTRDSRIAL